MKIRTLDSRLLSAARFVRQGAVFADIGTDHAHLPIFLLKQKKISRAVLSDINRGPLDSARDNVIEAGLLPLVDLRLTDGARELSGLGITDVSICGMGGELIARIIKDALWLFDADIRLILHPMTRVAHLRRALAALGFKIEDESHSEADGKNYVTICAHFDGCVREIDDIEAEIGEEYIDNDNKSAQILYFERKRTAFSKVIEEKRRAGIPAEREAEILSAIEKRLALIRSR